MVWNRINLVDVYTEDLECIHAAIHRVGSSTMIKQATLHKQHLTSRAKKNI